MHCISGYWVPHVVKRCQEMWRRSRSAIERDGGRSRRGLILAPGPDLGVTFFSPIRSLQETRTSIVLWSRIYIYPIRVLPTNRHHIDKLSSSRLSQTPPTGTNGRHQSRQHLHPSCIILAEGTPS